MLKLQLPNASARTMRAPPSVVGFIALTAAFAAQPAFAAGYDTTVLWSGRYAGVAGAAVATVEGAQSLYFNPAGLSLSKGIELDLEFSPTFPQFSGPITSSTPATSKRAFLPIFSGIVGYRVTKRLGLGAGVYVVGGDDADYGNVDFSAFNPGFSSLQPSVSTYLRIIEGSIGASYEIIDGLRIGAAWRVTFVDAELHTAIPFPPAAAGQSSPALAAIAFTQLADVPINGFRVGAQYSPRSGFYGFGLNWRTPVSFSAEGNVTEQLLVPSSSSTPTVVTGIGGLTSTFPSQLSVGGFIAPLRRQLRIALQYDYTNYGANSRLGVTGVLTTPLGGVPFPSIPLNWSSQHTVRIGAEYLGWTSWALRAGYALTTQVTSSSEAQATLPAPGLGHTFTIGAGRAFGDGKARVDLAGEYSFDSGDGTNLYGISGHFKADLFAVHLGGSYSF